MRGGAWCAIRDANLRLLNSGFSSRIGIGIVRNEVGKLRFTNTQEAANLATRPARLTVIKDLGGELSELTDRGVSFLRLRITACTLDGPDSVRGVGRCIEKAKSR